MMMKSHVQKVHEKRTYNYECHVCSTKFPFLEYLRKHVNLIHAKHEIVFCQICKHPFPQNEYWKKHMKTVHKNLLDFQQGKSLVQTVTENFSCRFCFSKFATQNEMQNHIRTVCSKLLSRIEKVKEIYQQ